MSDSRGRPQGVPRPSISDTTDGNTEIRYPVSDLSVFPMSAADGNKIRCLKFVGVSHVIYRREMLLVQHPTNLLCASPEPTIF